MQYVDSFRRLLGNRVHFALNTPQREAIRERDGNQCQGCGVARFCNRDVPERVNLQVHHIIPQGYANRLGIDPDYPENLITICEPLHVGHPTESVHPDTYQAKMTYQGQRDAYHRMKDERAERLNRREVYWNTQYDRLFSVIAVRNTQRARAKGWTFPDKKPK